jgi:flagellar biosynthesis protein FliR
VLTELLQLNIFAFFMIFARLGTAISFMPGFSVTYISARMRLGIALAVSFAVTPVIGPNLPVMPTEVPDLGIIIAAEMIVGSFIGILARILISALQTAGTVIALTSAMANALVQDPIAEQQSSTISGFLLTVGVVLVFVADFHHLMIRAAVESYEVFQPGNLLPAGDLVNLMARRVADSFTLGVQLAAPSIVIGLTYYIGLGLLGRLMPQLPVFFFGLPVQISLQLWVLLVTLSGIMLVFAQRFQDGIGAFVP